MPTIALVSSKGGVGKTTTAFLLASFFAKYGPVTLVDADPNHPIQDWAKGGSTPTGLNIVSNVTEDTIIDQIQAAKTPLVIVDLEGTASKIVLIAVSQADLVIIPMQGSQLDANEANRAIRVVKQSEQVTGKTKPFAVLLTRTSPSVRARGLTHIHNSLIEAGIPVLNTELHERDAFKAMFSFRQTLDDLKTTEVANLDRAKANIADLAGEVLDLLLEGQKPKGGTASDRAQQGAA